MSKESLIIIDVQQGFLTPDTAHVPHAVTALQNQFETVTVTRFVNPPGSAHRRFLDWGRFAPNSAEAALAFDPAAHVSLRTKSLYTAAPLTVVMDLKLRRIDTVHLAGIATDNCVLKTAVDLFEAGLRPVVHSAACGSHGGAEAHRCGLLTLRRMIGADQVI